MGVELGSVDLVCGKPLLSATMMRRVESIPRLVSNARIAWYFTEPRNSPTKCRFHRAPHLLRSSSTFKTSELSPNPGPRFMSRQQVVWGWGVNTDLFLTGLEEFLLSVNYLIISLGGPDIGLRALIMSLEVVWTSVWEFCR